MNDDLMVVRLNGLLSTLIRCKEANKAFDFVHKNHFFAEEVQEDLEVFIIVVKEASATTFDPVRKSDWTKEGFLNAAISKLHKLIKDPMRFQGFENVKINNEYLIFEFSEEIFFEEKSDE